MLRSEDLAARRGRDVAFLAALRARLDAEPALLAPAAVDARAAPQRACALARLRRTRRPSPQASSPSAAGARAALAAGDRSLRPEQARRRARAAAVAPTMQAPLAAVAEPPDRAAERAR